ncbi:hypothetical protein OTV1_150 [Ostreococcus tauri virus 1]|uniref:hypothetical protein n=1 Tax=Ostreococcus tauri virus 1 TaxID=642926 RepID=UPI0001B5F847|nr:hypothetical protein OTV1_150 [Ostreococcus tauri virus 1]CAY39738.1 hypothetical protein OTV1_150 [Ostreococcus tauri virus 1]
MMGGEDDKGSGTGGSGGSPAPVTFVVPTAADKLNECYGARHWDLRAAFGTDGDALGSHYTTYTTNGSENRNNSCTLSDEEAQCYLDRYPDAKTYAGTDLKKARKHYYETGMAQNRDFACGLSVKELQCYVERYPDLQTAFGTDYAARGTDKTLYKAGVHWDTYGKGEDRDYSCP